MLQFNTFSLIGSATEIFQSSSDNAGIVLLSNSRNHLGMGLIESAVFDYDTETDFIPFGDLKFDGELNRDEIAILVNLNQLEEYDLISDLNYNNKLDVCNLLEMTNVIIS